MRAQITVGRPRKRARKQIAAPARPEGELATYRAKRSADRTAEPFGGALAGAKLDPAASPQLFVIQMHGARRLHWDLRLEMGGVLRSWAVPRGPSLDPDDRRMAVLTEDHPIEYVDFEGVIPDGNYGAGPMIVWDRGVYTALIPMDEGFAAGKLLFELHGHKLRGVWTLVRTAAGGGKEWLLIKKPDGGSLVAGAAIPGDASVLSGLTIEQLRAGYDPMVETRRSLAASGAPRTRVDPRAVDPMLAQAQDAPMRKDGWLFELKYDGYRVVASATARQPQMRYRSGIDATAAFPEIARGLAALPCGHVVLDGEVVVLDEHARPDFQRLQKRALLLRERDIERATREHPVVLYAFDLLGFEDWDLRPLPLVERKRLLAALLPAAGAIRFADHVEREGVALFEHCQRLGLEGIVGKRAESPYVAGRSALWVKIRTEHTADFAIVGFTAPEGSRVGFGALHLAAYDGERLQYVGRVGTGFDDPTLVRIRKRLDAALIPTPVVSPAPPALGKINAWTEPILCAEVRFKHVTDDGMLRHPVFLRLREDKAFTQCDLPPAARAGHIPTLLPSPDGEPVASVSPATAVEGDDERLAVDEDALAQALVHGVTDGVRRVTISNPDKLFWPDDGYRKRDLIGFYERVSPWLLPYLRDRPLVLTRYPDGITGKSFFQKNAPPYVPSWIRTQTMWSEHAGREIEYFVCDHPESLAYVANLATIPLHVWGSRLTDLQHPDWCILDLDPKGAPFPDVVRVAFAIRALCDEIDLPVFLKTSGSTGLHVLLPLGRRCTFEQCRQLGEVLARVVSNRLRDIATIERHVPARRGRVYIDYLQNGHRRLLVAPLSVRPLRRAPVSTPLAWDELRPDLDTHDFNIATVPARLEASAGDPMRAVLDFVPDLPAVLERLLAHLERSER